MSNMSNKTNSRRAGGYQNLIVYHLAVVIYDLTHEFCRKYLTLLEERRTKEQMIQAARSGKQNIVEGSLEKSMEGNIKLTGVARASFGELLEDYKDFLRTRKLTVWDKQDSRVLEIRAKTKNFSNFSDKTNLSYWSNWINNEESYCNLMLTLINIESYLLDRLLRSQEEKFVKEGGFRENLFQKRMKYRNRFG